MIAWLITHTRLAVFNKQITQSYFIQLLSCKFSDIFFLLSRLHIDHQSTDGDQGMNGLLNEISINRKLRNITEYVETRTDELYLEYFRI